MKDKLQPIDKKAPRWWAAGAGRACDSGIDMQPIKSVEPKVVTDYRQGGFKFGTSADDGVQSKPEGRNLI